MQALIKLGLGAVLLLTSCMMQAAELSVCAVPQLYKALEYIRTQQPPVPFKAHYDTATALYAQIANHDFNCDLLLSSDERLPSILIRSNLAQETALTAFARAPLILWSADPALFARGNQAISDQRLKSLAIPKPELTPVGFAAHAIVKNKAFPTEYLNGRIYRANQEYQVYSMVRQGSVQAGFITKPLIANGTGINEGSYWRIPRRYYPDILYYALILNHSKLKAKAQILINHLMYDAKTQHSLKALGFEPLSEVPEDQGLSLPDWQQD